VAFLTVKRPPALITRISSPPIPSKAMRGWRESAKLVSAALKQARHDGSWFVMASNGGSPSNWITTGQTEPVVSIET
jgi:hypothetical protein